MAYNLDTIIVLEMEDFRIPLSIVRQWEEAWCEGFEIKGEKIWFESDDFFKVSSLNLWGEGSGTFFREQWIDDLKQSRGVLKAVLIWEGGDAIHTLSVIDGVVELKKADLRRLF